MNRMLKAIIDGANAGADAALEGKSKQEIAAITRAAVVKKVGKPKYPTHSERVNAELPHVYLEDDPITRGLTSKIYFMLYPRSMHIEEVEKTLKKNKVKATSYEVEGALDTLINMGLIGSVNGGYKSEAGAVIPTIKRLFDEKNIEIDINEQDLILEILDGDVFRQRIGSMALSGLQKYFNAAWFIIEILGRFGWCGQQISIKSGSLDAETLEQAREAAKGMGFDLDDRDAAEGSLFMGLPLEFLDKLRELTEILTNDLGFFGGAWAGR